MPCVLVAAQVGGGAQARGRQARRPPRTRCGQLGRTCREHRAATPAHLAAKTADPLVQADPLTATRQIGQRPLILRVAASGSPLTQQVPRSVPQQADLYVQRGPVAPDAVNPHSGALRKEQRGEGHGGTPSLRVIGPQRACRLPRSAHRACGRTACWRTSSPCIRRRCPHNRARREERRSRADGRPSSADSAAGALGLRASTRETTAHNTRLAPSGFRLGLGRTRCRR